MSRKIIDTWTRRKKIHDFLKENPGSLFSKIRAAFEISADCLRRDLEFMAKRGNIGTVEEKRSGVHGKYIATSAEVYDYREMVENWSENGRRMADRTNYEDGLKPGGKFHLAYDKRRRILDHLIANPLSSVSEIMAVIKDIGSAVTVYKIMHGMMYRGEVAVRSTDAEGRKSVKRYLAIKEHTVSAEESVGLSCRGTLLVLRDMVAQTDDETDHGSGNKSGYIAPGHYRHYANTMPPNSGGQGGMAGPRMRSMMIVE